MQQLRSIKTSRRAGSVPRGIILNGIGSPTELCRSDNVLVCRIVGPPTPHLLQLQAVGVCTLQSIEHRFQNQTHTVGFHLLHFNREFPPHIPWWTQAAPVYRYFCKGIQFSD